MTNCKFKEELKSLVLAITNPALGKEHPHWYHGKNKKTPKSI
jgi:hypothetical protein